MTELEKRVIDAAKEWLVERTVRDPGEKALAVALAHAFPEWLHSRETCQCGDQECDECPTSAQNSAVIDKWEREGAIQAIRV